MIKIIFKLCCFCSMLSLLSCKDFLAVKPSADLIIPTSLKDYQQLLDNGTVMYLHPDLLEIQADDFNFPYNYWTNIADPIVKYAHIWADDIYASVESNSAWDNGYRKIMYANVVIDGLNSFVRTSPNAAEYNRILGSAYFVRAEAAYTLSLLFSPVYDSLSVVGELGIPIPMESNVQEKVMRRDVKSTFGQIIDDLNKAAQLLDNAVDYSRPSTVAVHAMLAKIYLYMGNYHLALKHSRECLKGYSDLTDFNVERRRDYKKSIYFQVISPTFQIGNTVYRNAVISTELYGSYEDSDFRKTLFFGRTAQQVVYKIGINNLGVVCFSGLDTDEQFLISAECNARLGHVEAAADDMNILLSKRYDSASWSDLIFQDKEDALEKILKHRRKELVFRGIRWSDLKRFNRDRGVTLTREWGDQTFVLGPASPNWTLAFPPNELKSVTNQ